MNGLGKYNYTSDSTFCNYTFFSEGPVGIIQKAAMFTEIEEGMFNFSFGDVDPVTKIILDKVVSNNQDTDLIMGTLGSIIEEFTYVNPGVVIYAEGSTKSRTRFYQMNINRYWNRISAIFYVLGLKGEDWVSFEKGVNYDAFAIQRKDIMSVIWKSMD